MKEFSASSTIDASPETVWSVLVDGGSYPDWDPGMSRLEGRIAPGEKITAYTKISPDRAFPVTVSQFDPPRLMEWSSHMPLGLFSGVRTFRLSPRGDGGTDFHVQEVFKGLLLPIIGRTIPDLTETFAQFAAGLKARAESVENLSS